MCVCKGILIKKLMIYSLYRKKVSQRLTSVKAKDIREKLIFVIDYGRGSKRKGLVKYLGDLRKSEMITFLSDLGPKIIEAPFHSILAV